MEGVNRLVCEVKCRVPDRIKALLRERAAAEELSESDIIRRALRRYLLRENVDSRRDGE